jgi:hypothetical protein
MNEEIKLDGFIPLINYERKFDDKLLIAFPSSKYRKGNILFDSRTGKYQKIINVSLDTLTGYRIPELIDIERSKHYIPDISEFYVGFEYERKNGEYWEKDIITPTDLYGTTAKGYENEFEEIATKLRDVRVKYLDREDIESLGFERDSYYCEIIDNIEPTRKPMMLGAGFSKNSIVIQCICDSPNGYGFTDVYYDMVDQDTGVYIIKYNKEEKFKRDKILFSGKIKNKSELKKILKQIGVSKDE